MNYQKALAIFILAEVWAGGKLPPAFIEMAERIKKKMQDDGTWESA